MNNAFRSASGARVSIAILATAPAPPYLDALARELGTAIVARYDDAASDLVLAWSGRELTLHDRRDPQLKPFRIDFPDLDARPFAPQLSRRQPLARAMGKGRHIADATGGFLQDAVRLALMGFHVTAIERSRVVAALAADALRRLRDSHPALAQQLRYETGDARLLLSQLSPAPDVVYLDPMFPAKRRSSTAVRKELKWLRDLVGDDPDSLELFDAAMRTARERVVVKRPDHAPPLAPHPAGSIAGKLVRYDIYSTRIAPQPGTS